MKTTGLINIIPSELQERIQTVRYEAGEQLIHRGKATPFYIIKSGHCKVYVLNSEGGEVLLGHLGPGDAVGEMSNLTQRKSNAYVVSVTQIDLFVLSEDQLDELFEEVPTFGRKLLKQLCLNLERTNAKLTSKVDELIELNANLETIVGDQVADLKEHQTILEEQNGEMKKIVASRDEFMNMVVHDLRSPINNVIGFSELLVETGSTTPESRKMLEIISKNSSNMLALINDLLDYSKIESGKLELECAPLSLLGHVDHIISSNQILYDGKGIFLNSNIPENLPVVQADERRLAEILNNLLSNALKFSSRGSSVELSAELNGEMVEICVRDEGQGIAEAEIPKLFATFQQISTQATEGEKGTGLGLAIVRKLVELHGGKVWVNSTLGKGSNFCFTLPCVSK
ncbi:MAG: cyclic nucleotide-binding domain-containing protein [Planctomycetes bacterium]|nr:cyclic nucleotide-binding domain-containing protein [Planctomycetota bacterium]